MSNALPLPHPWLPGDQKPDSFEDRTQQNMDALAVAVGEVLTGGQDRRLWGIVGISGGAASVAGGTGFSVAYNAIGLYTITYTAAFSSAPSVTVIPHHGASDVFATLRSTSATSFQVAVNDAASANTDANVHFHVIGPR